MPHVSSEVAQKDRMEGLRVGDPDEGGGVDARGEESRDLDGEGVEGWMRNNNEDNDDRDGDDDVSNDGEECIRDTG